MIIPSESLPNYRSQVAMVDGGFDPLHAGHLAYFKASRRLGLPVLCNMASDNYVSRKHPPVIPEDQRAQIIDALKDIDYVHVNRGSTAQTLRELQPRFYVKGKEWEGKLPEEEVGICAELGIEIVFLNTVLDSSTRLVKDFLMSMNDSFVDQVKAFEDVVTNQVVTPETRYDNDYFIAEWREGKNSYALETRRELEGRNPAIIKEVFQPQRVLDMGCGPGALMYLLHELGVVSDGIDFAPASRELAPAEVRDRIIIGPVTEPQVEDNSYDLVICREVFEHLTVLQIRETVRNIVRATSKYIYVTTRFHANPTSLLSIATHDELDPTHISMLNKEFLRVLFVLEGCRQRPDLEEKVDWMKKNRVLIYEKIQGLQL